MRILITGPQGCGKTTQAEILAKKFSFCLINAGDLLRELADQSTEEGENVRKCLSEGIFVDDKITAKLVRTELEKEHCQKGFVMDGFPRRMSQLEYFDPVYDQVFYLDVPDDEVIKRLLLRGREDDTPEVIRERLGLYHSETEPVLTYYQGQGKLKKINGEHSIEEIATEIEDQVRGEMA